MIPNNSILETEGKEYEILITKEYTFNQKEHHKSNFVPMILTALNQNTLCRANVHGEKLGNSGPLTYRFSFVYRFEAKQALSPQTLKSQEQFYRSEAQKLLKLISNILVICDNGSDSRALQQFFTKQLERAFIN